MKVHTKSFHDYLIKRLKQSEIDAIHEQARKELEALKKEQGNDKKQTKSISLPKKTHTTPLGLE